MYDRYDRQVRLIGKEVQAKIEKLSVSMISHSESFLSGEILKNMTLLGVRRFKVNAPCLESYKRLVLGDVDKLNENLELEIVNELDLGCDVRILVDYEGESEDAIYICTKCYTFRMGGVIEGCKERETNIVKDCLLGAFVVQEVIKKIADKEYLEGYTLSI